MKDAEGWALHRRDQRSADLFPKAKEHPVEERKRWVLVIGNEVGTAAGKGALRLRNSAARAWLTAGRVPWARMQMVDARRTIAAMLTMT